MMAATTDMPLFEGRGRQRRPETTILVFQPFSWQGSQSHGEVAPPGAFFWVEAV
jgi:hypothetical protein